ncbi:MAG: tetratricopeptide repeat protein [Tepidisphaeraceae bacterium]
MVTLAHPDPSVARARRAGHRTNAWRVVGLFLLAVAAYLPVILNAGYIWDDPDYLVNNYNLRTLGGIWHIWFDPRSLPQYYPMVHSTFWAEYRLWGLDPHGYHTVNVLLHATAACLLWQALTRLEVPGALLAAAVFAVHPVHVESVAWVTERKNVLSLVFYLASLLAYLKWDSRSREGEAPAEPRVLHKPRLGGRFALPGPRWYAGAITLFVLALLSKTVTCSLPAAILLIVWWKRRRVRRVDVMPLVPFFAIGLALAMVTARLEQVHVGAAGADWDFSPAQRLLIAGRALWFYAGKLLWPLDLAFIYPKWALNTREAWQWAFPVAAVLAIAALWLLRGRIGRGPLVAVLFFCGTLVPALGFFNVYPMRYTFAADHFQYHASIGLIALACAAGTRAFPPDRATGRIVPVALVAILALLTLRQGRIYHDAETLWRATLEKNPRSWMIHTNLGHALVNQDRLGEAAGHYERALALAPDLADPHRNVGLAHARHGRHREAVAFYQAAVGIDPKFAPAYVSLGNALDALGDHAGAINAVRQAAAIAPDYAPARFRLGLIHEAGGELDQALDHYRAAVRAEPYDPDFRYNLAQVLLQLRRFDAAAEHYRAALALNPNHVGSLVGLGSCQLARGDAHGAGESFGQALRIDPANEPARRGLQEARRRDQR